MNLIVLLHTQPDGSLPKAAFEAVTAAKQLTTPFSIGILGANAKAACDQLANAGATAYYAAEGDALARPRYATYVAAAVALVKAAGADVVVAPQTLRFARALPGAAYRIGAAIDTHVGALTAEGDTLRVQRWFYRQRILGSFSRAARPWVLLVDAGIFDPFAAEAGTANAAAVDAGITADDERTTVTGVQAPSADGQTIRPDAKLLFVAGAGWTKKQGDGAAHLEEAAATITGFLAKSGASLGSSKSLVDMPEAAKVFSFMSHMNQVGQTGSTPRHPKGLATCCHGEEPHVVGWRFINERRAVNTDPNCGWAQGKADVVYVADAFEVMAKVNALMGQ
ncbi:MAG: electron transfer flavoprotein subunit alpha [Kiritimatiellae bacterium]|nr:electron transfer flavoprotein subunit alpha [Kiritimatiellia bacterium]